MIGANPISGAPITAFNETSVDTLGRAVDEAGAGGTQAVLANSLNTAPLEVSLNSAITEPASPTGNT